jgi:hypothetical protein
MSQAQALRIARSSYYSDPDEITGGEEIDNLGIPKPTTDHCAERRIRHDSEWTAGRDMSAALAPRCYAPLPRKHAGGSKHY